MIPAIYLANKRGIPRMESTGVTVNTANVAYTFRAHNFTTEFNGLVIIRINSAIPTGTTGTLPVVFTSERGTQQLTTIGGVDVTAADITGTGIYLCYYDQSSSILQVLTGIA